MGLSLIGAGVLGAIRDYGYGGDIIWASGYEKGAAMAKAAHLPLLISFHFSGCDWCRKMDAETFTDSRVVALSHSYVCVRIDALRDPELIQKFHVIEYPETLITDELGRPLKHIDGFVDPTQMAHTLLR